MSRGKPSNAQLELSMEMMDVLKGDSDLKCETGVDCRNYGVIDGIPEAKRLLGEMSEVDPEHIIIYGKLKPERYVRQYRTFHDSGCNGKYSMVQT